MRRAWIALAVLIGLALVVDTTTHAIAQRKVGEELGRQFDLARAPEVSLSGWPFLFHLATGEFAEVRIRAPRLVQGSVELTDIDLRLVDVEVAVGRLLDGDRDAVKAHSGRGRASITPDSIETVLAEQGVDAKVDIEGGVLFVTPQEIGQTFEAAVGLNGSMLTIEGGKGVFSFEIELPPIAKGMTYESVELQRNAAVLQLSFTDAIFTPIAQGVKP